MAEEENGRIEEQRTKLGPNGLAQKEKELKEAMEFNEVKKSIQLKCLPK